MSPACATPACALVNLLLSVHVEKGGEVASQWDWSTEHASRTLWRHGVMLALAEKVRPKLTSQLQQGSGNGTQALHRLLGPAQNGVTPLHVAAYLGIPSLVVELLNFGAPLAALNAAGRTPMQEAMYRGNHEVVMLLLRALPRRKQVAAREEVALYAALSGSALRAEAMPRDFLDDLPAIARHPARVDPVPRRAGDAAGCAPDGAWGSRAGKPAPPPAGADNSWADSFADVDQRSGLSEEEYFREYFSVGRPVLIRNAVPLAERCTLAADAPQLRASLAERTFKCGATAYPKLTGRSNCREKFTFHKLRDSPVCQARGRLGAGKGSGWSKASGRGKGGGKAEGGAAKGRSLSSVAAGVVLQTRPVCNWKLGRESSPPGAASSTLHAVNATAGFRDMPAQGELMRLRHPDKVAPLAALRRGWGRSTSRALWGGTAWSGSGFHWHNPAYNVLFFGGPKKWMITPPRYAGLSDLDSFDWPDKASQAELPWGLPLRFTQQPGDLVLLPAQWGHSTLTADSFSLGLGVLWCDARWLNITGGTCHL